MSLKNKDSGRNGHFLLYIELVLFQSKLIGNAIYFNQERSLFYNKLFSGIVSVFTYYL